MRKDDSELIQFLSENFSEIHVKLDSLTEKKADKEDVHELINAIEGLSHRVDTILQEFIMLTNKVNRLEKWIKQVADKAGVKLEE